LGNRFIKASSSSSIRFTPIKAINKTKSNENSYLSLPHRSEQISPNTPDQLERVALKFNEDLQQKLLSTRTASDQALKFRVVELCALIQRTSAVELYTYLRTGLQKELQLVTEKSVAATAGQSMPLNPYNMNNTPMVTGYMDPSDLLAVSNSCNPAVVQNIGPIQNVQNTGGIASPALGMATPKVELYEVQHQIMQSLNEFGGCANALKVLVQNYGYMLNSTSSPNAEAAFRSLIDEKAAIVITMRRSFMYYESLHELVIHELKNWRHQQAQAGNGAPFNEGSLDDIQRCFEMLETFIAHMLAAVKETMRVRLVTLDWFALFTLPPLLFNFFVFLGHSYLLRERCAGLFSG